eukprot:1160308-Pelagomonas_calceolata.AAC.8
MCLLSPFACGHSLMYRESARETGPRNSMNNPLEEPCMCPCLALPETIPVLPHYPGVVNISSRGTSYRADASTILQANTSVQACCLTRTIVPPRSGSELCSCAAVEGGRRGGHH